MVILLHIAPQLVDLRHAVLTSALTFPPDASRHVISPIGRPRVLGTGATGAEMKLTAINPRCRVGDMHVIAGAADVSLVGVCWVASLSGRELPRPVSRGPRRYTHTVLEPTGPVSTLADWDEPVRVTRSGLS